MARIIETSTASRRVIKLSTNDILSVVKEYQAIVPRFSDENTARNYLDDRVIFILEDI